MLRIFILQNLYDLADMKVMNEILDSRAFTSFCCFNSPDEVPDGDTINNNLILLYRMLNTIMMKIKKGDDMPFKTHHHLLLSMLILTPKPTPKKFTQYESGPVTQKNIEDIQEEFKYFRTAMHNYMAQSPRHIFREVSAV